MRGVAGRPLSVAQFVAALAITAVVTEVSFRFIETPIRRRHVGRWWRRLQAAARSRAAARDRRRRRRPRRACRCSPSTTLATAELKPNEIAQSLDEARRRQHRRSTSSSVPTTTDDGRRRSTPADRRRRPRWSSTTLPPGDDGAQHGADDHRRRRPTTTTLPPGPPPPLALGDSVMLGAADELAEQGHRRQRRGQPADEVDDPRRPAAARRRPARRRRSSSTSGRTATSATRPSTEFFSALSGVPQVLVLTVTAPGKGWIAPNNAKLVALPAQFPNVTVLYWDGLAAQCPGNCFYDDGIHLTPGRPGLLHPADHRASSTSSPSECRAPSECCAAASGDVTLGSRPTLRP